MKPVSTVRTYWRITFIYILGFSDCFAVLKKYTDRYQHQKKMYDADTAIHEWRSSEWYFTTFPVVEAWTLETQQNLMRSNFFYAAFNITHDEISIKMEIRYPKRGSTWSDGIETSEIWSARERYVGYTEIPDFNFNKRLFLKSSFSPIKYRSPEWHNQFVRRVAMQWARNSFTNCGEILWIFLPFLL